MTPYIVKGDDDVEALKHIESSRMSWCLGDVVNVHGDVGLSGAYEPQPPLGGGLGGPQVICPDDVPYAMPEFDPTGPELIPAGPEQLPTPTPGFSPTPQTPLEESREFGRLEPARPSYNVQRAEFVRPPDQKMLRRLPAS